MKITLAVILLIEFYLLAGPLQLPVVEAGPIPVIEPMGPIEYVPIDPIRWAQDIPIFEGYTLTGIVLDKATPLAVLESNDETQIVGLGDEIDGWIIMEIDRESILLGLGVFENNLSLSSPNKHD